MSVYSVRLFAGIINAQTALYLVPASTVIVVRDLEVWFNGSGTGKIGLNIVPSSGSQLSFFVSQELAANTSQQWTGRVVLNSGDQLSANATAWPWGITASGYNLGPP